MYIVSKPDLIQATQKQPKVLAFPPIEAKFASRICGVSQGAESIVNDNVNGEEGDTGMSMESYAAMRAALSPSAGFDDMNRQMIENVAASLDGLKPSMHQPVIIGLSKWFRRNVTAATTNSVYGPLNPFKDQSVVDAFWYISKRATFTRSSANFTLRDFNNDLIPILVGVLPSITARKGLAGRAVVAKAFEQYFRNEGHKKGSVLAKNRYEVAAKNGIALEDIAKFEVGGAMAILVNTTPAAFWTLFFIYSTPGLLEDVRREIDPTVISTNNGDGLTRSVDIKNLKQNCPLLISAFQETLRYCAIGTSVRQVMEDTVLDGQWLLKKDSMVQMPTRIIHKDSSLWGTDVDAFNPRRFLKDSEPQKSDSGAKKRPNAAAFRTFGGGTTLCPGRHFATNEILAVTAMFVLRYDMAPVAGSWSMPSTNNSNMAGAVMEPDSDIEVAVSQREGFEEGRFACGLKDSDVILAVTAEDHSA